MSTTVDLRQLAVDRESSPPGPRRHIGTRYVLPGVVLLGFLALVAWAVRGSLLPVRPVTVLPVIATRAEVQQGGSPLFLAAGWIEPRPTPILVTALTEGVVEQLLVVEGQEVKAGDALAKLIDADARLALAGTEADLRQKEAEAEALLAKTETDLVFLPFQIQSAEAHQRLMRLDYQGKKSAEGTIPAINIARAESELATATAKAEELKLRKQRLEREVVTLKQMRDTMRTGKEFQAEQALTETEANMRTACTRVRQAQIAVDSAKLRLERTTVRAPVAGRVLALIARPGSRLGMTQHGAQEVSTVVSLYNPAMLQVRADVRFEDLPNVQPGQPVRIESPALPGKPVAGEVLLATSIADIQKNTLQVKVAIPEPPPVLKPDMLVQLTFLAPERPDGSPATAETLRLLIPRQLVENGEGGPRVWVADQVAGVARHRAIKQGRAMGPELVEVVEGLSAADKLIVGGREGLTDGARIKVTGEDASLGTAPVGIGTKPVKLERLPPAGAGHQGKH
jgi:RND family efflux transporter MFP subunit